eukprot:m.301063 g.301063  ORF g.301063 m.301063 type:complete len:100 (+) comp14620_c0_seq1:806-1105(+)
MGSPSVWVPSWAELATISRSARFCRNTELHFTSPLKVCTIFSCSRQNVSSTCPGPSLVVFFFWVRFQSSNPLVVLVGLLSCYCASYACTHVVFQGVTSL